MRDTYLGLRRGNAEIAEYSLNDLLETLYKLPSDISHELSDKYIVDLTLVQRAVRSGKLPDRVPRYPIIKHQNKSNFEALLDHHIEDAYEASVQGAWDMAEFSIEDAELILSRAPKSLIKKYAPKIAKAKMDIFVDQSGLSF